LTGCEIQILESNFLIPTHHHNKVLKLIKEILPIPPTESFAWVEKKSMQTAQTLEEVLKVWGWATICRWNGIVLSDLQRHRWGDDELLLGVLSLFAEKHSWILMRVFDRMSHAEFQCKLTPSKKGIQAQFGKDMKIVEAKKIAVIQQRKRVYRSRQSKRRI